MPILSVGGMRFQQSWTDLSINAIENKNQWELEAVLEHAKAHGLHHIETARHYGSSELQLGLAMQKVDDSERIIQTKIPPRDDASEFERELELSFQKLNCKRIDLLAIHGLNLDEHLDQTIRPGGCLEVVRKWQSRGLIGHVGFSTHAATDLIIKAIETNEFDYVNLHWYFIFQDNEPAIKAANKLDLGVFIISPTDKGGHLHSPSPDLLKLCSPLHPIVFNDLFCLQDKRIHTISIGVDSPANFKKHLEAVDLLNTSMELIPIIQKRLLYASRVALGSKWLSTWKVGLPSWNETPGEINIPVLLWLYNLMESWGMENYAKTRYRLLGQANHWFPGANADHLDQEVCENDLKEALYRSPWQDEIPNLLRKLKYHLGGDSIKRLSGT
ncbi:Aldo/keto reductase family [Prochlorococcus sp. MIT 0601]|nr:Aldo/keto reductase family [Prochlorococcus sp. MIT 0601]